MLLSPRHLPERCFDRNDPSDDTFFYREPRKVVHIDDGAIAALSDFLAERVPPGGVYLDLMSSWRSHLPSGLRPRRVIGLGMNAEEMADNPQLDEWVVHNLNTDPKLPFADQTFDAVTCTVSVQYMTCPLDLFAEIIRTLKPGAPCIVSFSNRCFPQKAIALWLALTDAQHVELVTGYFGDHWGTVRTWENVPDGANPIFVVWANRSR